MQIECPACQSSNLRYSRLYGAREHLLALVGIRPLRCRVCRTRFVAKTWNLRRIFYARCPRCWRMDLSQWREEYYCTPFRRRLAIALGAHKYRCEYCRVNFTSFRPRLTPYRRKRTVPRHRPAGAG